MNAATNATDRTETTIITADDRVAAIDAVLFARRDAPRAHAPAGSTAPTIPAPRPVTETEATRMANRLAQLSADVRIGRVPAWQVETLLQLLAR